MRALKAVLAIAGTLKRRSINVPEEQVLIQAMRDANLPKLLSEVGEAVLQGSCVSCVVQSTDPKGWCLRLELQLHK